MARVCRRVRGVDRRAGRAGASEVNCHHNYTTREHHFGKDVWLSRKGRSTPTTGVIGSDPRFDGRPVLRRRGKGHRGALCSSPHGAGRNHSRTAARKLFTRATSTSGWRASRGAIPTRSSTSTPTAYKPIDVVMHDAAIWSRSSTRCASSSTSRATSATSPCVTCPHPFTPRSRVSSVKAESRTHQNTVGHQWRGACKTPRHWSDRSRLAPRLRVRLDGRWVRCGHGAMRTRPRSRDDDPQHLRAPPVNGVRPYEAGGQFTDGSDSRSQGER